MPSAALGQTLPFDLPVNCAPSYEAHPHLAEIDAIATGDAADVEKLAGLGGNATSAAFHNVISDFYLTNPIARASATMAECSALAKTRAAEAAE
ncbi:hypothetical protein [Roseibium sp.]|uniref:hypothetical protein n=1 Tax=Roseibium sp. TaxID=1936156 RepID=UPI003A96B4E6